MPVLETETSSPITWPGTSFLVTTPVVGFSVTSAPCPVTATMAGGVSATVFAEVDADGCEPGDVLTPAAGAGLGLWLQAANNNAAATAAPRTGMNFVAGIAGSVRGFTKVSG